MIEFELYERIKEKYGGVASWAVWKEEGLKPKSNMGNLEIFDLEKNPGLLQVLKTNVIMVGLNFSRPVAFTKPFNNFHDATPSANDFKIRYAFKETEFYGAYMTDVIKNTVMISVDETRNFLKKNPHVVREHIAKFHEELNDIEANKPILLAFGNDVYNLLANNLHKNDYSKLIKLTHYSHHISKENYKEKVMNALSNIYL